jgi:hypothetical protein
MLGKLTWNGFGVLGLITFQSLVVLGGAVFMLGVVLDHMGRTHQFDSCSCRVCQYATEYRNIQYPKDVPIFR